MLSTKTSGYREPPGSASAVLLVTRVYKVADSNSAAPRLRANIPFTVPDSRSGSAGTRSGDLLGTGQSADDRDWIWPPQRFRDMLCHIASSVSTPDRHA
jgi:hypothetical protein